MKKLLKKLSVMRLEERVLFDAAAAAAAMEADQQNQQNEELQQQQQQLQEQLAEEAARQQAQAEAQEAAQEAQEDAAEAEAQAGAEAAAAENQESVTAGSEVSAAVEAIASDEGIEVESDDSVLDVEADDVVGENLEGLNGIEAETEAAESALLTTEEIAAAIADGSRHELVIVSGTVQDSKVIIDGLAEGTEVLVLENDSDVLDQINEYLDNSAVKYDAIHVISHGGDGYMVLNNSVIDMESLEADPASWAAIGEHVAKDGDILLYGCNIAQTENGKAFASQLASLTGADIAASVDVTGGSYGWELEYVTNAIATPVLSFNGYDARLNSLTVVVNGSNYDKTTYADSEDGTTKYVVEDGKLVKQTWAAPAEGEDLAHVADKDEVIGGDLAWAIDEAAGNAGVDTIVIQIDGNLSFGTISDVNITLGASNSADFGTVSGEFSVTGGTSVTISSVQDANASITEVTDVTLGGSSGTSSITITANGTVNATGDLNSTGKVEINGAKVELGAVSGASSITVNASGNVETGALNSTGDVSVSGVDIDLASTITTAGTININGTGSVTVGSITSSGAVNLEGGSVSVTGDITAANDITVTGETSVTVNGSVTSTSGAVELEGGSVSVTGDITAANDITVTGETSVTVGSIESAGTVTLTGASVSVYNTVTLNDTGSLTINASETALVAGSITGETGAVTINGTTSVTVGSIKSAGAVTLAGASVSVYNTVTLNDTGSLTINASGTALVAGSITGETGAVSINGTTSVTVYSIESAGTVTLTGASVTVNNDVALNEAGTLTIKDSETAFVSGSITGETGAVTINGTTSVSVSAINTSGDVSLTGGSVSVVGDINVAGNITVNGKEGAVTVYGAIESTAGAVSLEGGSVSVSGDINASGNITVNGKKGAVTLNGAISGSSAVSLTGDSVSVADDINAIGDITVTGKSSVDVSAISSTTGNITVDGKEGIVTVNGAISGSKAVSLTGGSVSVYDDINASGNITVTGKDGVVYVAGAIESISGDVSLTGYSVNVTGDVSGTNVTITGTENVDVDGAVSAAEKVTVTVTEGDATIGNISNSQTVTIQAENITINNNIVNFKTITIEGTNSVKVNGSIAVDSGSEITFQNTAADKTGFAVDITGDITGAGTVSFSNISNEMESAVRVGGTVDIAKITVKNITASGITQTAVEFGKFIVNSDTEFSNITGNISVGSLTVMEGVTLSVSVNDRVMHANEKIGLFGEKYRFNILNDATISKDAQLIINNLLLDVNKNATFNHEGHISGIDSEVVFREGVTLGYTGPEGGTVDLDSVRYENGGVTSVDANGVTFVDANSIYWGFYDNLALYLNVSCTIKVDLFEQVDIGKITFINRNNHTVGYTGSEADVTMSGRFSEYQNVTFDFEVGSKVNVIYDSPSQQYVLGGNYYELTVKNTAEKILSGSITVGVSVEQINDLKNLYGSDSASDDFKALVRKMEHLYRGGISLGTTLQAGGYDVDFYGYTHSKTDNAFINSSGRVSYHVTSNFVDYTTNVEKVLDLSGHPQASLIKTMLGIDDLTQVKVVAEVDIFKTQPVEKIIINDNKEYTSGMLFNAMVNYAGVTGLGLEAYSHEVGGIGPNASGDLRISEEFRAFFGGTYQDLTIDTLPTLPAVSGAQVLGQYEDGVVFNVDVDATVKGNFMVASPLPLDEFGDVGDGRQLLQVNVSSTMTFNRTSSIALRDASLHFKGNVLGDLGAIDATRSETFTLEKYNGEFPLEDSKELELTFDSDLGNVGLISTTGVALTFNGNVGNVALGISVDSASAVFKGNVGNIGTILAVDSPEVIFNGNVGEIKSLDINASPVTFNGDVQNVDTIDLRGDLEKAADAQLTFNGAVNVSKSITTHMEYDDYKAEIRFNGKTTGSAEVESYRGRFYFTADDDQSVFQGTYDELHIDKSGTKTIVGDVSVKGLFDGNESAITIAEGKTLKFSNVQADSAADFTVMKGAKFHFGDANTSGTKLNGTITSYGEIEFFGKVDYDGTVTLEEGGKLIINDAAQGSTFSQVINKKESNDLEIYQKITIEELHNYGTVTITNNDAALNVYNHEGADLIFDLKSGTAVNGAYSYTFGLGENDDFVGGNRLINGGTISVESGSTLNLNNFTQGDKNAETGKWTYGGEAFVIKAGAALVLGASAAQVNAGNVPAADMGADTYLGDITNSGTFTVADTVGTAVFTGNVTNEANSKFILSNTEAFFHGDFIHDGSLETTNATAITFATEVIYDTDSEPRYSTVSGNGTIGGTTGYAGTVAYKGAYAQQILTGTYNNTVTLSGLGERIVAGDVVFNSTSTVHNNAIITGTEGSVVFKGNTTDRNGAFEGSLDVTYSENATVIFGGSYGDLVINSTTRNIDVDLTAESLVLSGSNTFTGAEDGRTLTINGDFTLDKDSQMTFDGGMTLTVNGDLTLGKDSQTTFNGTDAENTLDLIVDGNIVLGDNSQTTFGEFSSLNAGSETAAVIKGGKGGTLTISTVAFGENVTVYEKGISAAVTYDYAGEATQRILNGSYLSGVTVTGSAKVINGDDNSEDEKPDVSVAGLFASSASALTVDGTLEVLGTINVEAIEVLQGARLNLNLTGASTLGTVGDSVTTDAEGNVTGASATGVIMGGTLNINGTSTLTVYGWQDKGSAGAIHLYSGNIEFAGTPDVYGYVGAILSNYTTTSTSVVDTAERLQNWWITITQDSKISDYEFYTEDSKFRVINGATLTIDYFAYPDPSSPVITDTVEAFRLENGSTLVFAMTPQFGGTDITINELIVQESSDGSRDSHVVVNEGYKVTVAQSADIYGEGAVQGAGNLTFKANGTYTGNGTFNMTGGKVVYGSNTNVYAGTYNDLQLYSNNTLSYGVTTVNGAATLYGTGNDALFITDGAALTFAGTTNANGLVRINGEAGTSVTYGENANIYAGTYGNLTVNGEADRTIEGDIAVNGTAAFAGSNLAGSGNWIFNGEVFGNENGTSVNNTGSVAYTASGNIFGGTYNTLKLDGGNTISADLTAENVQLSDGLNVTAGTTVTFNATTNANAIGNDGYIHAEEGANVIYNNSSANSAESGVYSGIYHDLAVNGDMHTLENRYAPGLGVQGITVNGEADFSGVIFGDAKVTFNGTTVGNALFGDSAADKTYTGAVSYSAASETIYGGQYNNLTIAGDAADVHNVNASLTVNVAHGGRFSLGGVLNLMDNVILTINGSTDARVEGNTGSIQGAYSSYVVYGYNADIYGGTYGNLITNGTEYVLVNDIVVNGLAHLSGTFLGDVDVTFKDQTSGTARFGVIGDETKVFGGTVTYKTTADTIFGGYYNNLVVQGKGAHTIGSDLAVKTNAVLAGTLFGTGNVTFDEGATLGGNAQFGKKGSDYQGTVTYNGDSLIYDGHYTGMNFNNNNTITSDITASGDVTVDGVLTLADGVEVTFSGSVDANANRGTVQAENATLNYIGTGSIYGGTYGNLNIAAGDYTLLTNSSITVEGNANIEGTILGKTKVTFNGNTTGTGTFGDIAADRTYIGAVSYGVAAATIYGGQYNNIIIAGGAGDTHTVTSSLKVNVPEGGKFRLSSKLVLNDGVELTLNGLTDANEEGNTGLVEGSKTSSVVYALDADVYGGTYGNLAITGGIHDLHNDFTVENAASVSGSITGDADILFKGGVTGDAVFGSLVNGSEVIYNGAVTYDGTAGEAQTVFKGYYHTLNIIGDHTFENELRVNAFADFKDGVMMGDATVTFDQGAALSGNGTFGVDADNRYQGDVFYNGVVARSVTRAAAEGGMFGGFYTNLIIDGTPEIGNTTSAVIDALDVKLSDALIITHNGAFTFAGTTDADQPGNDGYIEAGVGTSVTYADTAALYGGTYGNLTFGSDRVLVFDMTVNGLASINGTMTGTAGMTFNSGIAGDARFGTDTDPYAGTVTFAGADSGVYGGFYKDLVITGNHLLENAIVVVDGGNASINNGSLNGTADVTFNGNTSGNSVFGTADTVYTGKVTYSPNATVVYGGFYNDLVINGDHLLEADFTVVKGGTAALSGNMTGTADLVFNGATSGDATFGTADTAYAGDVTFGAEAQLVYNGHYTDLTIEDAHTLDGTYTVAGLATFTGEQKLADATVLTFNGKTNAADGTATLVDASTVSYSTVTYGADAAVYGGAYGNLTINGAHTLTNDFTVGGTSTVDSVLGGTANVTFLEGAVTEGEGTFGTSEVAYAGIVTYQTGVALYNGTYSTLVLDGARTITDRTVTVTTSAVVNGTQTLEGTTKLTLSGANTGTDAEIIGADTTTVIYNGAADQNVYTGTYGNLEIVGDHLLANDFTVNTLAPSTVTPQAQVPSAPLKPMPIRARSPMKPMPPWSTAVSTTIL